MAPSSPPVGAISYKVPEDCEGYGLKAFLKQKGISGSRFRSIKQRGCFYLNGQPVQGVGTVISAGDTVSYALPEKFCDIEPEDIALDIRYEDDYFLAVNKPAGMVVHPVSHHVRGTLAAAVLGYFRRCSLPLAFHGVHRLDRLTSGLVLIAKRGEWQNMLSSFGREYLALATGIITPAVGTIDAPIARDPDSIITRCVSAEGKSAITHYRTLRVVKLGGAACSLLWLSLVTGRTHQIRVHLSYIGHPLLGDDLYGGSVDLFPRQALHAARLGFLHPILRRRIDVYAPLPADMQELLLNATEVRC